MTFLAPIGALALLAIPAIVLLYFLKVRRPEFRVGALLFWRPYVADRQANAPWQRLRWSLLLLLQLLIAAALAFALLRPGIQGVAGVGTTTVVMIDGSASMQATDVSPTRFAAGVAKARSLAGQLGPGQRMAIVVAGEHASLLAPPSSDPAVLGAGVVEARLTPGDAFALDDTAWLVTAAPAAHRVLLVSDGNGFLDRALKLRPGLQLTVQKPAEYKSGQNFDLYVFDGFVPSGKLPGSVRTARFVVLFQDSNLSRIQPGGPPLTEEASGPAGPVARGTLEIWPWLAALALALLVVEWLVFHRGTLRWSFR